MGCNKNVKTNVEMGFYSDKFLRVSKNRILIKAGTLEKKLIRTSIAGTYSVSINFLLSSYR